MYINITLLINIMMNDLIYNHRLNIMQTFTIQMNGKTLYLMKK
jgi:hypothetical protein